MAESEPSSGHVADRVEIVDETLVFTLTDLCRACRADQIRIIALVDEGVLAPSGSGPDDWLFSGPSLPRARTALRLESDLELGPAGTALVLDLLDQIDALSARLRRAGIR